MIERSPYCNNYHLNNNNNNNNDSNYYFKHKTKTPPPQATMSQDEFEFFEGNNRLKST